MSYRYNTATTFNPSTPPFQPNGSEVQISQYAYSDPRTAISPLSDVRALIFQSHSHVSRDIAQIELQLKNNTEDIQSTNITFRDDMRSLQKIIRDLQGQVEELKKRADENTDADEDTKMVRLVQQFREDNDVEPTDALKTLAGNDEVLAEAYFEYAEDAEKFAAKLRERGHILLGDIITISTTVKTTEDRNTVSKMTEVGPKGGKSDDSITWVPRAVREMPQYQGQITDSSGECFSEEFILSMLGGQKWSPGFYFITKDSTLPIASKGYWILEADCEPFLPVSPGQNGAKLTIFFNDTFNDNGDAPSPDNYMNTPVFICPKGSTDFKYFGQYSQTRFSDKLDYDTVTTKVPEKARLGQAEQYANHKRPAWVTQALMQHFWPKPTYDGPLPTDDDSHENKEDVSAALWEHAKEVAKWEKNAKLKASLLTKDVLMKSFENSDTDIEPGLRMHWEYMQCVSYDEDFYSKLIQHKYPKANQPDGVHKTKNDVKEASLKDIKQQNPVVQGDPTKRYQTFAYKGSSKDLRSAK